MAYQVIRTTNNWDRRGNPANVQETLVAATADLREAFQCARAERAAAGKGATYAPDAVRFRVVDDAGAQVLLDTLFQQLQPHLYEAIEHQRDEGLGSIWIDLDGWFAMGCPGLG